MNDFKLTPIENDGQRVLTTAQLAEFYGTSTDNIKKNFERNRERFIEGKHYYCLTGEDLKAFKSEGTNCRFAPNLNKIYLWTEKGALLHAKCLGTDKAWDVHDQLVETYFRAKDFAETHKIPHTVDKLGDLAVKEMNARVRMSNQFLKLAKEVSTLSSTYKNIMVAKSAEALAGEMIIPLPEAKQKTYSATEVGKMFGVSANKIGRIALANGLKTDEYGEWYHDKKKHCDGECNTFRYNDKAVEMFRELLE